MFFVVNHLYFFCDSFCLLMYLNVTVMYSMYLRGARPARFTAVCCDRTQGSFSWHLFLLPPFATSPPPTLHTHTKKKITWLCPAGLPVAAGIASGARQTRRALCAHGHGPRHCLQQCAGLRPQHRRWHGSERHHYCKWWRRGPRAGEGLTSGTR